MWREVNWAQHVLEHRPLCLLHVFLHTSTKKHFFIHSKFPVYASWLLAHSKNLSHFTWTHSYLILQVRYFTNESERRQQRWDWNLVSRISHALEPVELHFVCRFHMQRKAHHTDHPCVQQRHLCFIKQSLSFWWFENSNSVLFLCNPDRRTSMFISS